MRLYVLSICRLCTTDNWTTACTSYKHTDLKNQFDTSFGNYLNSNCPSSQSRSQFFPQISVSHSIWMWLFYLFIFFFGMLRLQICGMQVNILDTYSTIFYWLFSGKGLSIHAYKISVLMKNSNWFLFSELVTVRLLGCWYANLQNLHCISNIMWPSKRKPLLLC